MSFEEVAIEVLYPRCAGLDVHKDTVVAAVRKKQSYLPAPSFSACAARRDPRKAICAVAASILTAAYHMLKDRTLYADPGPEHFRKSQPATRAKALARQIERLGFTCSISPVEPISI